MAMYFVRPDELHKYKDQLEEDEDDYAFDITENDDIHNVPPLNIIIMIVGSRGDVQPFIAFGKGLVKAGHRVRLCTHVNFRDFVTENGLEFYPLGGNPEHLMNFMVNHPDMITLDPGEIARKKLMMEEIYHSTWDAATGLDFKPDFLISNPPVHVHIHLAQRLQVPLIIMFTMPWSATKDYMHPLAPMQHLLDNMTSYSVVDRMIWVGLGSIMNEYRKKIGLSTINRGAMLVPKTKVPQVYCMSPHLAPKPTDWGKHIDVVGFWYLDLVSNYNPPKDLTDFLEAGEPPVYIGFGSIVVDNPKQLGQYVIEGIKKSGRRALVSPGWAKLGEGMDLPPSIKLIGAAPHDWLFTKCAGVVHHGGAGTTAAGLKAGCPTLVVPFFGDQPFWGSCVAKMGVGPTPIPYKQLNSENLCEAIKFLVRPDVRKKAEELGEKLRLEDGVEKAVEAFHRRLPMVKGMWLDEIHENQRKYPLTGWSSTLLPTDRYKYTDKTGLLALDPDRFTPHDGWKWAEDWTPVVIPGKTDAEGWVYGTGFGKGPGYWKEKEGHTDFARTRKLVRKRKFVGKHVSNSPKRLLYLEIIEAKDIPNMDLMGKSDPFCVVTASDTRASQKTATIENTLTPVWKQTLWFEITPETLLKLECFDEDPVGKDFIGEVTISAKHAIENDKKDEWLPLSGTKGKERGQVHVKYHIAAPYTPPPVSKAGMFGAHRGIAELALNK